MDSSTDRHPGSNLPDSAPASNVSLASRSEREAEEPSLQAARAAAAEGDLTGEDVSVKRAPPVGLWSEEEEDPYVRKSESYFLRGR